MTNTGGNFTVFYRRIWTMFIIGLCIETISLTHAGRKDTRRIYINHGSPIVDSSFTSPGRVSSKEPAISADSRSHPKKTWNDYLNTLFDPAFDLDAARNVTAVLGDMAHLPCRVNNLGTKTVSWIRHHDTHILTVGSFTYTGDERFSALHREGTNEWTLQIKNPTLEDSGLYECQVSTKPVRAYLVKLKVVIPTSTILHSPELHTHEGDMLNLTCIVSPSPGPPEYIFWYHENEVVNYDADQDIHITLRHVGDRAISTFVVATATFNHSGIYTCEASNARSSEITVHIFKAEEPEAMQTSSQKDVLHLPVLLIASATMFLHVFSTPSPRLHVFLLAICLLSKPIYSHCYQILPSDCTGYRGLDSILC